MSRFLVLAVMTGCASTARAPLSQRVAGSPEPPTASAPAAPKVKLIEHEMPDMIEMPTLAIRPAAAPRDDRVMRECLEQVKALESFGRLKVSVTLRAVVNNAIAIGGDCRLAADHALGATALRRRYVTCGTSTYDIDEAWQAAAAVATTPERRNAALRNLAILMWRRTAEEINTADWTATAIAFERASAAEPGDPLLATLAVDAWDNALRTVHATRASRTAIDQIAAGLRRARGPRAAQLLATVPR